MEESPFSYPLPEDNSLNYKKKEKLIQNKNSEYPWFLNQDLKFSEKLWRKLFFSFFFNFVFAFFEWGYREHMFLTKKNSSLNLGITSQKILKFPKKRNVKYNHSEISLYTLQDTYNEKDKKKSEILILY